MWFKSGLHEALFRIATPENQGVLSFDDMHENLGRKQINFDSFRNLIFNLINNVIRLPVMGAPAPSDQDCREAWLQTQDNSGQTLENPTNRYLYDIAPYVNPYGFIGPQPDMGGPAAGGTRPTSFGFGPAAGGTGTSFGFGPGGIIILIPKFTSEFSLDGYDN